MQILWTTIAPALLSGFFGAFVAVYFTDRHQREQWVNDHKCEEYRQILANLSDAIGVGQKAGSVETTATTADFQDALIAVSRSTRSAIFTSPTLDRIKVIDRFTDALVVFSKDHIKSYPLLEKLYSDIRAAAREDIGLKLEKPRSSTTGKISPPG